MYCCQEWGREGGDLWWCHSLWLGVLPVCPPLTVSQPFCVILSTSHELQIPLSHSAHFLVNLSEPFCPLFGQPLWAILSTFWSTSLSHSVHFLVNLSEPFNPLFGQPLSAILSTFGQPLWAILLQVSVNLSELFCSLPSFCQPLWTILSTFKFLSTSLSHSVHFLFSVHLPVSVNLSDSELFCPLPSFCQSMGKKSSNYPSTEETANVLTISTACLALSVTANIILSQAAIV